MVFMMLLVINAVRKYVYEILIVYYHHYIIKLKVSIKNGFKHNAKQAYKHVI